jgi:hypothetical protein
MQIQILVFGGAVSTNSCVTESLHLLRAAKAQCNRLAAWVIYGDGYDQIFFGEASPACEIKASNDWAGFKPLGVASFIGVGSERSARRCSVCT